MITVDAKVILLAPYPYAGRKGTVEAVNPSPEPMRVLLDSGDRIYVTADQVRALPTEDEKATVAT